MSDEIILNIIYAVYIFASIIFYPIYYAALFLEFLLNYPVLLVSLVAVLVYYNIKEIKQCLYFFYIDVIIFSYYTRMAIIYVKIGIVYVRYYYYCMHTYSTLFNNV